VYILPDTGLGRYLPRADLDAAIAAMTPQLAQWQPVAAFRAGFAALGAVLESKHFRPQTHGNELRDGAVAETGAP
jgi:uncharacterized membrane protein